MTRLAHIVSLILACAISAPVGADQILPPGRHTNGNDILFGTLRLGNREAGQTIITPDTLQILGSGLTGEVDGFSVKAKGLGDARALSDWIAEMVSGQRLNGILRSQIGQVSIPAVVSQVTVSGCVAAGDGANGSSYVRGTSSGPMAVQDALGAWWQLVRVGTLNAGAFCIKLDDTGDNGPALQAAAAQAFAWGAKLDVPAGKIRIASTVSIDISGATDDIAGRFEIAGAGRGLTVIRLDTPDPALCALRFKGGRAFSGHANASVSNLMVAGVTGNGRGICGETLAELGLNEVFVQGLRHAYYLTDVLSTRWVGGTTSFNFYGIYAARVNSSGPNAFSLFGHRCANNNINCMELVDGSALNYIGGSVEGNGLAGNSSRHGGILLTRPGIEGGVAANLTSYFEHNGGVADVRLIMGTTHPVTLNVQGSNFNRISPTEYTTNNIRIEGPAGAAAAIVNVTGSSFRRFGGYAPSLARPYVTSTSAGSVMLNDAGAFYESAEETPTIPTDRVLARARFDGSGAVGAITPVAASGLAKIEKSGTGSYTLTLTAGTAVPRKTALVYANFPVMVQSLGENGSQVAFRLFDQNGTPRDVSALSVVVYDN